MSIDRWSRNEIALGMCPDGPFVQLSEYESLARQHREEVEAAEAATLRSQGQAVASGDVGREAWTIADRIEFALRDAGFTEADAAKYTAAALRSQEQAPQPVVDASQPQQGAVAGWVVAADRELVCAHLGVASQRDDIETARKKLRELIDWHVAVALDPDVSREARALIARGKSEAQSGTTIGQQAVDDVLAAILYGCPNDGGDEELILRRAWDRARIAALAAHGKGG